MVVTIFERIIHIADCFNIRAIAARYSGEDTPVSYLEQCNVYRSPLTDDNGNEIDNLTTMNVDFDYYRNCPDSSVEEEFGRRIELIGLRLVRSGEFTSEKGGGHSYHIEI